MIANEAPATVKWRAVMDSELSHWSVVELFMKRL